MIDILLILIPFLSTCMMILAFIYAIKEVSKSTKQIISRMDTTEQKLNRLIKLLEK
uniref:DUF4083 domain-containing protein n=1 Tax=Bacillus cereus HuA4-10 TaxID=1053206 RepID=J8EEH3_BACCE|nr:hypothetical protein IGC_00088 [Bacillus cereus HuA4-10]